MDNEKKASTQDINITEVKALYFQEATVVEPNYKMYRLDTKSGDRNYYEFDDNGKPFFYTSVTTFIKNATGANPFLLKWYAEMGMVEATRYMNERAAYGTFLHMEIEKLTIARKYDLDALETVLTEYIELNRLPADSLKKWYKEAKKDILSWGQFMIDYNVEPVAIEVILRSKTMKVAGALDLVCYMDIEEKGFFGEEYKTGARKGEPKESKCIKRILAIVDVKSGKKGFFESHEIQLHTYKMMWEENYPKHKIDKVFNWSGAEWRTSPSFKLKDQTGAKSAKKIPQFLKLAEIELEGKNNEFLFMDGMINLSNGLEANYKTISKEEYVVNK